MVRCLQHVEACWQLVPFETWETVTVSSAETVLEAFDLVLDWGQLSAWCSLGANTLLSLPPEHLSLAPFCPFCPVSPSLPSALPTPQHGVVHAFNLPLEAEAGRAGSPTWSTEWVQANQSDALRSCINKQTPRLKKNNFYMVHSGFRLALVLLLRLPNAGVTGMQRSASLPNL